MKTRGITLSCIVLLITTGALAQSAAQKPFDQLKALAGS